MAVNCPGHPLEDVLDSGGVAHEGGGHLETPGGDVTHSSLDVVGDPFDEVGRVLVLDVKHLLVNLLHGHPSSEDGGHGEVPSVPGSRSTRTARGTNLPPAVSLSPRALDSGESPCASL